MSPETRRAVLRHAVAIDLMIIAAGIAYLAPESQALAYAVFLIAVALSVWIGGDDVSIAPTAYAVAILSSFFTSLVDAVTLTLFALTGAVLTLGAHLARSAPAAAAEPAELPRRRVEALPHAVRFALPFLAVVLYTDVSDVMMESFSTPSLLQPLILLFAIAVVSYRHALRPLDAVLHPILLAFFAYAVIVFSTSIWARNPSLADTRLSEVIKALLIAALCASLAASWQMLRRTFAALVAAAAILATLSVVQVSTGRFADAFGGLVELKAGTIYGEVALPRAAGPPVSDPNFYARILVMTIPLAIGLAATERGRRRVAWLAAAAMIVAGVLATYSRGAMVALAVMGVLLLFGLRVRKRWIAAAAAACVLAAIFAPPAIARRLVTFEALLPGEDGVAMYDSAVEERKLLLRTGMAMFAAHPWTGVGSGHYSRYYMTYSNDVGYPGVDYDDPGSDEYPHGLFVELASETGLLGLAAFTAVLLLAFRSLLRSRRALLERGEKAAAKLVICLAIALATYLTASLFLHETHLRYAGLYLGLVMATARLASQPRMVEAAA